MKAIGIALLAMLCSCTVYRNVTVAEDGRLFITYDRGSSSHVMTCDPTSGDEPARCRDLDIRYVRSSAPRATLRGDAAASATPAAGTVPVRYIANGNEQEIYPAALVGMRVEVHLKDGAVFTARVITATDDLVVDYNGVERTYPFDAVAFLQRSAVQ